MKLLCLVDSPTVHTGFAKVGLNLITRWSPHFERIDIWGVNFGGFPHALPWRIYPAGYGDWNSTEKLAAFLNLIMVGDYTHLWMLSDLVCLCGQDFAASLKAVCAKKNVRTLLYYPVDAPLKPEWMEIVDAVDVAVTYTQYGARETARARAMTLGVPVLSAERGMRSAEPNSAPAPPPKKTSPPHILPHGVDTAVFRPLANRAELRVKYFPGWLQPDDFLIVNVNRNERRKAMVQSLQILKELMKARSAECGTRSAESTPHSALRTPHFKMLLHCPPVNPREKIDLEIVADQLGLPCGYDWTHNGPAFEGGVGLLPESVINDIYNCADLTLSTSMGEGWGFSITESAAAGCPVAVPDHSSCAELADEFAARGLPGVIFKLPVSRNAVLQINDNSRVRYPVEVLEAADVIEGQLGYLRSIRDQFGVQPEISPASSGPDKLHPVELPPVLHRVKLELQPALNDNVREWLSWDRIAGEWLKLFGEAESRT